jgi:putative isomerase
MVTPPDAARPTRGAMMLERWIPLLEDFIRQNSVQMMREPDGQLPHPYIVPSSPDSPLYSTALWDWDSWFTSVVLGQVEADLGEKGRFLAYEQGSILNFLEKTDADGVMPIQLRPDATLLHGDPSRAGGFSENMHKPIVAQHAALISRRQGDYSWLEPHLDTIAAFLNRYLESHLHAPTGLAYWQTDFAVGVDNDPSIYYRPAKSTASIYLNCLLYRELLAYGSILEELGDLKAALIWRGHAQDLADAMNTYLWDERDGTFYSADIDLRPIDPEDWLHSGAPRRWSSVLQRIDNWSSFLPLWAGFPSQEQAERMRERALDPLTFQANYGIRTLSRLEKMYDLRASNNPSNWLGPIWGISNYLVFRGLLKYGFVDDARELAIKTIELFGQDLETTGSLHEYYHPDSGEPIVTHGFQNWNFLVLNMIAYLDGRAMVTEF